ncbi:glycoside hydrolase family 5 protein [Hamadaea tsunoensis]|uniref:glycoside hydrolase family 5 protein n=1 Tax=Hamadaea tsunoensis TaxID=53368 RepID=UPI00042024B7|nr:cellulase family glycosylhydrolase [Hamadaea tsunoensis]
MRAVAVALFALVLLVLAGAVWDPSGLLAPVGGSGLPWAGAGGAYRWAPLVVGLPILLAGTALPVWVAARSGNRIFFGTWTAVVGAGAAATAATALTAAAPLVGEHLPTGSALSFAVDTNGFAAVKYLLVGPLVAAAVKLAARSSPGTPTDRPAPVLLKAALLMAVVVALAAAGPAARWWRGGPVGYAFPQFVPVPSAAHGVLLMVLGMLVFLGAFALVWRVTPRGAGRLGTGVAVWLAAVGAGVVLGVVDAGLAAAVPDRIPAGAADSWWIATTLICLATGTGYGALVGLVGAVLAAAVSPAVSLIGSPAVSPAAGMSGSPAATAGVRRRWVAVPLAVLVVVPLVVAVGTRPAPPKPAVVSSALHLIPGRTPDDPAVIADGTGRQVLLRGVDVNQLIDYYLRDPAVPATQALTDADFAQMAALGFNVVRLGVSWSRLEPQRGVFEDSYVDQIRSAVYMAKAHDIYTVLDMHEDAWGNALAKPDERCGGGTSPTTGWDGAPAWATITDGTAYCQFMARDLAPAVATAFGNFYTDRDGIQTELVRTWARLASAFATEPAVAGYDLLNEPGIGANPPVSSGLLLGRYYDAAITAIRAAERTAGGPAHLAFFEPSVLWSGLGFDVTPPPGFTADRQIVFAPHPYSESITMDQSLGLTIASIERNLAMSARAAAAYGAGLWAGEWGWFGDPDVDGVKVTRFAAAQDRLGIGGAFWVWRQGCGSPETGADATGSGNLVRVDCRTGESTAPPAGFAKPLSRAYPRALPGLLSSLSSTPDGRFTLSATAEDAPADCTIELWFPSGSSDGSGGASGGGQQPRLSTTGVSGLTYRQVDGGWWVTGCARGAYSVTTG